MANANNLNRFQVNPVSLDMPRSLFPMNHSFKASFNLGEVIPADIIEVYPGDTFSIDTTKVVRMQPLVAPIMDDVVLDTHWFFVPHRLIWEHFTNFFGENDQGPWNVDQIEYSVPKIAIPSGGYDVGTIADYIGVPVKQGAGVKISALPMRAYALVCDEFYRSESVMTPLVVNKDDTDVTGVNTGDQVTDIVLGGKPFIACKNMDYFTAALFEPQRGPDVLLPLGESAPLSGFAPVKSLDTGIFSVGDSLYDDISTPSGLYINASSGKFESMKDGIIGRTSNTIDNDIRTGFSPSTLGSGGGSPFIFNNLWADLSEDDIFADLSGATASSVNQLRTAFQIQKYYEKLARGGNRYISFVKSMFGVTSPDARLQRPEYLGGNRMSLNVSAIAQTSATDDDIDTPQGNLVGMSHTGDSHSDFTKSFTEHGYLLCCMVARIAQHSYQNGLPRHFMRTNVFDFYNPLFSSLGEQAIKTNEVFLDENDPDFDDVFGYQEAWAELRFIPNRVAGEMRSNATTPLDMWHLADDYQSAPQLGDSWLREDKSILDRCLAVTSDVSNQLFMDVYFKCNAVRCLPMYSIPGMIDHH